PPRRSRGHVRLTGSVDRSLLDLAGHRAQDANSRRPTEHPDADHATQRRRPGRPAHRGQDFFCQADDGIPDKLVTGVQTCALPISNAGNLLLARAAARQRDFAVRAALGAGRGELLRDTLIESVLLAVTGGIAGIALARWGIDLFLALGPELPRTGAIHLDGYVLGFALAVTAASAAFFGIAPALAASRVDLQGALRTTSSTA